jgi:hypothetical protein
VKVEAAEVALQALQSRTRISLLLKQTSVIETVEMYTIFTN